MTKTLIALLIGISVPLLLGTAQEADAAALFLKDDVENQITILAGQFEFFTTGTGTVAGETATFTGKWFVNVGGNPDPGSGVVHILDACTGKVSDIITASWSTEVRAGFDRATISVTIQSSPAGADLGDLPARFTGLQEGGPGGFDINGSFEDLTTGNGVGIPSNLGIRFFGVPDLCVDIDIKPGSDPSSVSCKNSKGSVPVAVFGSANFDVSTIDLSSLELNGVPVTEEHDTIHIEDLNNDGLDDAVLHLDKAGVCDATSNTSDYPLKDTVDATLTGFTTGGEAFTGIGDIRIVKR